MTLAYKTMETMLADCMTKPVTGHVFVYQRKQVLQWPELRIEQPPKRVLKVKKEDIAEEHAKYLSVY